MHFQAIADNSKYVNGLNPGSFCDLTLVMTSAQVLETSVNIIRNSPSQDYTHPNDHNLPTFEFEIYHTLLPAS